MAETASGRASRWLLPTVVALPFVAAVVIDTVRAVTAPPAVDRDLLEATTLRFDPADPTFDLRLGPAGAEAPWAQPEHALGSGWGEAAPEGRWTAAAVATVRIDLGVGGQRLLLVDCRADRRERGPVLLAASVNGVGCGRAELGRRLAARRFAIAEGLLRPGPNRLELRLVDPRTGLDARGRTALVRRLAVAGDRAATFAGLAAQPAPAIDRERGTILIRRAGRLVAPFETPVSGSVLSGRVRFRDPIGDAWCRVTVARRYAGPDRFDVVSARTLHAARSRTARIRQELRDRNEPGALIVEVNPAAAAGGVVVEQLRVEVDPKR
ncbi:MAG TPA: hypothetical protein PKJ99_10565 [Thermoanaerobaculales bacterium]|nr:hypothetical protein [Thermoanaerobaculales bacterium]HPA80449.1 hypothetical protein [Thermoanaerobaculales bacterium]HQL30514.1 hypothetical protein [Thermoanaerobaculales bacterium]HQN95201.1 hypothetical protein [Thermoanaerobaculales bacterium]HQP43789.1 hypothetical protein [Thermoanaerobaculales bacterium]